MSREIQLAWAGLIIGVISVLLSIVGLIGVSLALGLLGLALLIIVLVGLSVLSRSLSLLSQTQTQVSDSTQQIKELQTQVSDSAQQMKELRDAAQHKPPFTVLSTEKRLTFDNKKSDDASYVDKRKIRANHRGLQDYWFSELASADGVQNIRIDGEKPHEEVVEAGSKRVSKRFSRPLQYEEELEVTLTCDLMGLFPDTTEALIHRVVDETHEVQIDVVFHHENRCFSAEALVGFGGIFYEPAQDVILDRRHDGRQIHFEVKNPLRGQHYRVQWVWTKQ